MKTDLLFVISGALLFLSISLQAQSMEEPVLVRIQTVQGNDFIGTVVSEDSEVVVLQTDSFGEIRIRKMDIKTRTLVDTTKIKEGVFWPDNLQSTRYFWTPNGYGLHEGEGYYQNIWVLYNQVSYGFTKRFSVSAGMVPLFLFYGGSTPIWIVPKFSIPVQHEKVNIGAGAFIGTVLGESEGGFGIVFGTTTFGSRDRNVNLGLGWGYAGGSFADFPIINVSFMSRVGPKGYFISENYYINLYDSGLLLLSFGGRRMLGNVGLDFALYLPFATEMDGFVALPLLGLTIPFGDFKPGN